MLRASSRSPLRGSSLPPHGSHGYARAMASVFDSIRNSGFRRGPERLLAGICGGIAVKVRVNVWLIRLVMLLLFALPVVGWGLYLVVWVLTPNQSGSIPVERWLGRR